MTTASKTHWFGAIGTLFGCLALLAAILPIWVLPMMVPPEPIDKTVVEAAQQIKDRVVATVRGVEYQEPARKTDWYRVFSVAAATLAALALVLAAISFVAREPWRFAAAAAALGAGAIVFQISIALAAALVAIVLIAVVLGAFGAGS